jgi:hypothetical protein
MTHWPGCPHCGDYSLEGQATCGRPSCERELEKAPERITVSGRRKPFWQCAECC